MRLAFPFLVAVVSFSSAAPAFAGLIDTEPPVPAFWTSPVLSAIQAVSFAEPVRGVTNGNPALRAFGETASISTLRCRDGGGAIVYCGGDQVRRIELVPNAPLVPGRKHEIVLNPDGALPITDLAGNPAPARVHQFTSSTAEQELSAAAVYRWRTLYDQRAYGGSYQASRTRGSYATFRFSGTSVTWFTRRGPNQGKANVFIDGVSKGVVSNYRSSTVAPAGRTYAGLADRSHILTIEVLGQKGAARASDAWVSVDALRAGSGSLADATYRWAQGAAGAASGRRYARSAMIGDRVSFTFHGAGVDWFTSTGPAEGIADVFVDGRFVRSFDNYAPRQRFGVVRTIGGLSEAVHTVTIVVAGRKNRASSATWVSVDRWMLRADPAVFRKLGSWIDLFDYNASTAESVISDRIDDMAARGVKTLYLQTGRYNTDAIQYPVQAGQWLDRAYAARIRVVGWYLPAYSEYLNGDIVKTAAIAGFSSPAGRRFHGLAIDIEYRVKNDTKTEFFNGIKAHLAGVRARVGQVFPVGAITFAPLDMDLWPGGWSGFPWSTVATYANAVMPMSYWSNRDDRCANGQTQYCPYQYAKTNVLRARASTGLPVHPIGGVGNRVTEPEVTQSVQGTLDARAWGGSLYDYRTTAASFWARLARFNTL